MIAPIVRRRVALTGIGVITPIGTGRRDGLDVLHPAIAGHLVTPQDVPAAIVAARTSGAGAPLEIGSPLAPLADRLLPDVYVNTQPLPYYDRTPPGQVPTGGVHVGF